MDWGSQNPRPDLVIGAADLMSLGTHGLPKEGQRGLVWMFEPGEQTRDGRETIDGGRAWETHAALHGGLGEQRQTNWGSNARWTGGATPDRGSTA